VTNIESNEPSTLPQSGPDNRSGKEISFDLNDKDLSTLSTSERRRVRKRLRRWKRSSDGTIRVFLDDTRMLALAALAIIVPITITHLAALPISKLPWMVLIVLCDVLMLVVIARATARWPGYATLTNTHIVTHVGFAKQLLSLSELTNIEVGFELRFIGPYSFKNWYVDLELQRERVRFLTLSKVEAGLFAATISSRKPEVNFESQQRLTHREPDRIATRGIRPGGCLFLLANVLGISFVVVFGWTGLAALAEDRRPIGSIESADFFLKSISNAQQGFPEALPTTVTYHFEANRCSPLNRFLKAKPEAWKLDLSASGVKREKGQVVDNEWSDAAQTAIDKLDPYAPTIDVFPRSRSVYMHSGSCITANGRERQRIRDEMVRLASQVLAVKARRKLG
jgi:hypothetical protein